MLKRFISSLIFVATAALFGCGGGGGATLVSITVTPASSSIAVGATQSFTATGHYSSGPDTVLTSADWSSSNTSFATITPNGIATAVAEGTTTITAQSGAVTSNPVTLTVTPAPNNTGVLAGSSGLSGTIGGSGAAARFTNPAGITSDGSYLYVADNNSIRKINLTTKEVSTVVSSAQLVNVSGITWNEGNNCLYVTNGTIDTYSILKINLAANNAVTTVAVTPAVQFGRLYGITTDGTYLYVAENSGSVSGAGSIRRISISSGAISTVTSNIYPKGITWYSGTDTLYATDTMSNFIMEISYNSTSSLWDTPINILDNMLQPFNNPTDIVITDGENLYVADNGNKLISKVNILSRTKTTVTNSNGLQVNGMVIVGTTLYSSNFDFTIRAYPLN